MDIELVKEQIIINEKAFEGTAEHMEESDVIVPDYLPDVLRVIEVNGNALMKENTPGNGDITMDGEILFNVLYLAENGMSVRSMEFKAHYTHTFDCREVNPYSFVRASAEVEYCEVKILNSRKINVKAALSLKACAYNPAQIEFVSDIKENDQKVETLKANNRIFANTGIQSANFTLMEALRVTPTKGSVAEILNNSAELYLKDTKKVNNKVIVKGAVVLRTFFTTSIEEGKLETMTHEIPFSQIIEADGVDENSICNISLALNRMDIMPEENENGEIGLLNTSLAVTATVSVFNEIQFETLEDAFGISCNLELVRQDMNMENLIENAATQVVLKEILAPEFDKPPISQVIKLSAKPYISSNRVEEGKANLIGGADIVIIYAGEGTTGQIFTLKKTLPISYTHPVRGDFPNAKCDAKISISDISFNLNMAGSLEVRVLADLNITAVNSEKKKIVTGANVAPLAEPGKRRPAVLYFAKNGESFWDIAKKYSVPKGEILKVNNLEEAAGVKGDAMLFIPPKQ